MTPLFSVISVTLNNQAGLKETFESLAQQNHNDFEWLVIDGNSEDGTLDWLRQQTHPALRWISEPDEGLYDAMNKGISQARGKYLIFLNAGDCLASSKVLDQAAHSEPGDVLYGDAIEFDGQSYLLKRSFPHLRVWYSMFAHHQAIFYNRSAIGEIRYGGHLKIAADWALTAQMYLSGCSFQRLEFPVCIFARGGISQSRGTEVVRRIRKERLWVYRHIFQMPLWQAQLILVVKQASEGFRARFPKIYDRLRFSHSQP